MYIVTKEKIENARCHAISKYIYKTDSVKGTELPKDALIFKRANTKKFRLNRKKVNPSFNLMVFYPASTDDKREIRRVLERSLALKIAPLHFIFPNLDYNSLSYKKIRRPSEIRKNWENITIIASLQPFNSSTRLALRELAFQNISMLKDKIKSQCVSLGEKFEKRNLAKKMGDLKIKLRILKTKCSVFSLCFDLNLSGEYMKAYRAYNNYRKEYENLRR